MALHNSYAVRHPVRGMVVNSLLLGALLLLLYGLDAPILTLEKFYFFSTTTSLLSALRQLAAEAEWGLFVLIGLFSVVFPIVKILLLFLVWNVDTAQGAAHRRHLGWLATYSKWSMLDVVAKFGVQVVADIDVPMDPNVHQAIAMVESEEIEAGKVLGVMQKGYTLNGRTIRAAMVTVAKAKA